MQAEMRRTAETVPVPDELAMHIRRVALEGAVADKDVKAGKAAIEDGSVHHFNFWAHVQGSMTKGYATTSPARTVTNPAKVNLFSVPVVGELLRRLGATSADVRRHLKAIVKRGFPLNGEMNVVLKEGEAEVLQAIVAPFGEVAAAAAKDLPPVETVVGEKSVAGAVKVTVASVEYRDAAP